MRGPGNQLVRQVRRTGIHRRKGAAVHMSEIMAPIPTPAREGWRWWHDVHGPVDPLAAQYLAVTWPRNDHAPYCRFSADNTTPYDCDCVRRAQAIVAATLLRDARREGRWENGYV